LRRADTGADRHNDHGEDDYASFYDADDNASRDDDRSSDNDGDADNNVAVHDDDVIIVNVAKYHLREQKSYVYVHRGKGASHHKCSVRTHAPFCEYPVQPLQSQRDGGCLPRGSEG